MNRRLFLNKAILLPATIPLINCCGASDNNISSSASTTPIKPKVDKYADLSYGNTFKTLDSIYTVREIEMMCREWGWIHVETFIKKYDDWNAQNWICQAGIGFFIGIDGQEYHTDNTFCSMDWGVSPYNQERKAEFKPFLKSIAGDYYGKHREQYYFYDVLMPRDQYKIYDAYKDIDGDRVNSPSEYNIAHHGQKLYKIILYHMGVSGGKMWGSKNDK